MFAVTYLAGGTAGQGLFWGLSHLQNGTRVGQALFGPVFQAVSFVRPHTPPALGRPRSWPGAPGPLAIGLPDDAQGAGEATLAGRQTQSFARLVVQALARPLCALAL